MNLSLQENLKRKNLTPTEKSKALRKLYEMWVDNSYNPGITKLLNYWVTEMGKGNVLGIVPFLGITWSLLTGEKTFYLRCGAGVDSFGITTDGRILACPMAPEFKFNQIGDIRSSDPRDLLNRLSIGEPSLSCSYYRLCGGRCLFANKTMLWGKMGYDNVCHSIKYLIDKMVRAVPKILEYIDMGIVRKSDFNYPDYNNGLEVIP